MKSLSPWWGILAACAAACGIESREEDGDLQVIAMNVDAIRVRGVLDFVNGSDATFEVLDLEVGLDARAARGISEHVRGRDGRYASRDDDPFDTIEELDRVPYVGQKAFDLLDAYARMQNPGASDLVVEEVALTEDEARAILVVVNRASVEQLDVEAGLDARAAEAIVAARPIADVLELADVAWVGRSAIERLREYALRFDAGTGESCGLSEGTYADVFFSEEEHCRAVRFLNKARFSQLADLTVSGRNTAYHCGNDGGSVQCSTVRAAEWPSLDFFAGAPGVTRTSMQAVKDASSTWIDDGRYHDTIASAWADRSSLVDTALFFDSVHVTREIIETDRACIEVRDAPGAPNYLWACVVLINADSAPDCASESCVSGLQGRSISFRATLRRSSTEPGGHRLNLGHDVPGDANPAVVTLPEGASAISIGSGEEWRVWGGDDLDATPGARWAQPGLDDSAWADTVPAPTSCGVTWFPNQPWEAEVPAIWNAADTFSIFLRKAVVVPEGASIERALITLEADDDVALFVNGVEVYREWDFGVNEGNRITRETVDITDYVTPGENLVAMNAVDTVGGCRWLIASGSIYYTR